MTQERKVIVHIATSADGYIARPDGNLDWLTRRPAPKGFYGMPKFMRSVDAKLLGRKTFDLSVEMGAHFSADDRHYVFSRQPAPASVPAGVEFVSQSIGAFANRLRDQAGKNIWMMGGGEIIASFLDEDVIDEFIITVVPIFIGEGIPLIAPRHREVPLKLRSVKPFPDGVVQVHYDIRTKRGPTPRDRPASRDARDGDGAQEVIARPHSRALYVIGTNCHHSNELDQLAASEFAVTVTDVPGCSVPGAGIEPHAPCGTQDFKSRRIRDHEGSRSNLPMTCSVEHVILRGRLSRIVPCVPIM